MGKLYLKQTWEKNLSLKQKNLQVCKKFFMKILFLDLIIGQRHLKMQKIFNDSEFFALRLKELIIKNTKIKKKLILKNITKSKLFTIINPL